MAFVHCHDFVRTWSVVLEVACVMGANGSRYTLWARDLAYLFPTLTFDTGDTCDAGKTVSEAVPVLLL